jgi:hypothetical protein
LRGQTTANGQGLAHFKDFNHHHCFSIVSGLSVVACPCSQKAIPSEATGSRTRSQLYNSGSDIAISWPIHPTLNGTWSLFACSSMLWFIQITSVTIFFMFKSFVHYSFAWQPPRSTRVGPKPDEFLLRDAISMDSQFPRYHIFPCHVDRIVC